MRNLTNILILSVLVLLALFSSAYIVKENETAIVLNLGKIGIFTHESSARAGASHLWV